MLTRIFAHTIENCPPSQLMESLAPLGLTIVPHFRGDDLGWTSGTLTLPGPGSAIQLERWLVAEDDLRKELNTFAAELETMDFNPHHETLMQWVIQTQQLIAMRLPIDHADEVQLNQVGEAVTRFYVERLKAVFQVDGQGWYSPTGELWLPEY